MPGRCSNCDAPADKVCPRWRDVWTDCAGDVLMERNDITKNFRIMSGCFYDVVVRSLVEMCRSTNSAAVAVETSRNVIAEGFVRIAPIIAQELQDTRYHTHITTHVPLMLEGGNGQESDE